MRCYVLIAVLVTAMAIEKSEPQEMLSWKERYHVPGVHWGSSSGQAKPSSARASGARYLDQQQPNTGSILINARNHVQSEGSRIPSLSSENSRRMCGIDTITNHRIVGGSDTNVRQHPWLVQIEFHDKKMGISVNKCGGFLISQRYVLSAGHCFANRMSLKPVEPLEPVNVILGEYDQTHEGQDCIDNLEGVRECTDGAIAVPIDEITTHQQYISNEYETHNDIALVRMKRTVEYTNFIRPICLPTSDITESPPADLDFTVAGWGRTESRAYSSVKREVNLPYVNTEECRREYDFLTSGQMCAGGEADKDSCKGDSGGPLMYNEGGVYTAVGIVSTGINITCGTEGYKGLYTKVFKYIPWINDNGKP